MKTLLLVILGLFLAASTQADNWSNDPTLNGRAYSTYQECMDKSSALQKWYCNDYPDAPGNQTPTVTDSQAGLSLSQQFYCQAKGVLSGNLGLIAGLLLALTGLWAMVNGSLTGGVITLICGALITALPSLTESFLKGAYTFTQHNLGNGGNSEMCVPTCNGTQATGVSAGCNRSN